jgi:hypothetical protein
MRSLVERLTVRAWLMPFRPALHISFFLNSPAPIAYFCANVFFSKNIRQPHLLAWPGHKCAMNALGGGFL